MITKYKLFEANDTGLKVGDYVMLNGTFRGIEYFEPIYGDPNDFNRKLENKLAKIIKDHKFVSSFEIETMDGVRVLAGYGKNEFMRLKNFHKKVVKLSDEETNKLLDKIKEKQEKMRNIDPFGEDNWDEED